VPDALAYPDFGYGVDIAPSTISLGEGWRELEADEGGRYRRIDERANALFASTGSAYAATIDVAPAQGETRPVHFEVRVDGIVYFANSIHGRTLLRFVIPPGEAAMRRVALTATGGAARIYRLAALWYGREVVPDWLGFRIGGGGWYPVESLGTDTFRYLNREGVIAIDRPAKSLELDVEPGPGVAHGPFELDIFIGERELLRRVRVDRRMRITVELPALARLPERLVLRCDSGGRPSPPDARVMDFRLFAVPAPWERSELMRSLAALGPPADARRPAENRTSMDVVAEAFE
jgi:hypothetical protein